MNWSVSDGCCNCIHCSSVISISKVEHVLLLMQLHMTKWDKLGVCLHKVIYCILESSRARTPPMHGASRSVFVGAKCQLKNVTHRSLTALWIIIGGWSEFYSGSQFTLVLCVSNYFMREWRVEGRTDGQTGRRAGGSRRTNGPSWTVWNLQHYALTKKFFSFIGIHSFFSEVDKMQFFWKKAKYRHFLTRWDSKTFFFKLKNS